ncbi:MAG TPA: hypothetical protein VK988_06835 [Acidimicrobiales bacterium]|nr:hypothetical protein [Acidimicrobiales bacterium]
MKSDYHINVVYSEENGGYIADIPELQACSAFAEDPRKAVSPRSWSPRRRGCRPPEIWAGRSPDRCTARSLRSLSGRLVQLLLMGGGLGASRAKSWRATAVAASASRHGHR